MTQQNQTIAEFAYKLWEARGCPEGSAAVDWLEAERQVKNPGKQPDQTVDSHDLSTAK
jgi:hypothetical protein